MPNQNDNKIEALKNEAEILNTLMRELQDKLSSLAVPKQAEIETHQREIIDEIATLEAGIEEQEVLMNALRKKRKALQKKVEKAQTAKYKLQSRLKTQRKKLEKLGGEINTTEVYDNVITVLPEHTDEGARQPTYHVSKPSTDLGSDWADKYRDRRGNRPNA